MLVYLRPTVTAILLCLLCGCQSVHQKPGTPDAANPAPVKKNVPNRQTRNNAASLLYDLLNDEKNVSKVLIIKSAPPETAQLIKNISETSKAAVKNLEAMAETDHSLKLH